MAAASRAHISAYSASVVAIAGAAAAATRLTPFTQPDPTTNSGADQSPAAVAAAFDTAGD
ncbi:hypothetical protein JHV666_49360 [Mycobacterium avium subsp. hominissuis]